MTGAQSSERVTLAPCPFCNDGGRLQTTFLNMWAVKCDACHAMGTQSQDRTRAIAAWNRRAAPRTPATTGEGEVVAYLHTLHMEDDCTFEEVTRTAKSPFDTGRPVTTTPLYARAALPPSSGWQPIETAPRDGEPVDLWCQEPGYSDKRLADCWWDDRWRYFDEHGDAAPVEEHWRPTHWMRPLPPPPSSEGA